MQKRMVSDIAAGNIAKHRISESTSAYLDDVGGDGAMPTEQTAEEMPTEDTTPAEAPAAPAKAPSDNDFSDVTGLSRQDQEDLFEVPKEDDDWSDILDVSESDITGYPPKRRKVARPVRRLPMRYITPPPSLGGLR